MSKTSLLSWISLLFTCLATTQGLAQASLSADSNHVETGNALILHLQYPAHLGKPTDTLKFNAWANQLPAENIVEQSDWVARENGVYGKDLTVLFFDEDSLQLPPLPIALRNGDTLLTNALDLVVKATPAPDDLNDMAPIKDIHPEPSDWTDYLPWILGVAAVMAVLYLFYVLINRRREARMRSRTLALPPHELALKKLEVLQQKNRISRGQVKEHYAELTDIIREYLEKRFAVPALESTTYETVLRLKKAAFPQQWLQPLQELLEQADLAKFARVVPDDSFREYSFQLACNLVLETKPTNTENPENQQA